MVVLDGTMVSGKEYQSLHVVKVDKILIAILKEPYRGNQAVFSVITLNTSTIKLFAVLALQT